MKTAKILLSAILFLIFVNISNASYLNLSLSDNSDFTAVINNMSYSKYTNEIELNDLPGGSHYIKMVKRSSPGNQQNNVLFEGYVKIPDNCSVYASVDEYGNFMIYKKLYGSNIPSGGSGNECNCNCEECRHCRYKEPDKEIGNYENYRIMNSRDFAEFKQLIADRTFETTKMDMTKSVIDNNLFSTEQVKEMLTWFVFESNKLDIAKYAFKNVVDRGKYYKLYNSFVFESNVTDLDNYVKNYR